MKIYRSIVVPSIASLGLVVATFAAIGVIHNAVIAPSKPSIDPPSAHGSVAASTAAPAWTNRAYNIPYGIVYDRYGNMVQVPMSGQCN